MNQNPLDDEPHVRARLEEYHVEMPDFPVKSTKWNRFLQFLGSPAKDPIESLASTEGGLLALKVVPAASGAGLMLLQLLFFV